LAAHGYRILSVANTATKEHGIDVIASLHRYLKSQYVDPKFKGCADLHGAVTLAWGLTAEEWEALATRLGQVIKRGDFHFVVAA
jgi:hypothetical protein